MERRGRHTRSRVCQRVTKLEGRRRGLPDRRAAMALRKPAPSRMASSLRTTRTTTNRPLGAPAASDSSRRGTSRPRARDRDRAGGRSPTSLPLRDQTRNDVDALAAAQRDRCRTKGVATFVLRLATVALMVVPKACRCWGSSNKAPPRGESMSMPASHTDAPTETGSGASSSRSGRPHHHPHTVSPRRSLNYGNLEWLLARVPAEVMILRPAHGRHPRGLRERLQPRS
jgi:hypothetical protein